MKATALTGSSGAHMASPPRIGMVDVARGMALVAMTIFHFCWDLEMFGLVERGFMASPAAIWSARIIAGSFLFLVGVGLVLAHVPQWRWRGFAIRWAKIAAAAAIISLATYFATPDAFIFFGILHMIALGSVLALPFIRAPWWVSLAAACVFLLARESLRTEMLDGSMWWWTGLSQFIPRSNDYVPVFPFFGMVLLGVSAGLVLHRRGWPLALTHPLPQILPVRVLNTMGRYSLVYYLAHQPVMIALLAAGLWLTGRI